MEDKNLQDIKIDDIESSKKTPLKNILTLLALLFIILVISVVITKLILNTDDGQNIDGNDTTTEASAQTEEGTDGKGNLLTASGAAIAGAAVVTGTQNAADATKNAVVDAKDGVKNAVVDAKDGVKNAAGNATSAVKEGAKNATSAVTLKERNVSGSKTKVTLRDHQPTKAVKELVAPKSTSTKKDSSSTKKVTPTKKTIASKSSTSSKKSTANTSDKVVAKKSTASAKGSIGTTVSKLENGFYIKVGTFKNTTTAIKKVKETGLNYKLVKTKDGKLTRVYIGKFNSKKSAQAHLSKAKNVNEGAFIYEEK